jgi:hypothetical protein
MLRTQTGLDKTPCINRTLAVHDPLVDVPIEEARLIQAPELMLTPPPAEPPPGKKTTFNRTNSMVDWDWWTWNPVTGCLHDCPYCYPCDIAERLYPEKFQLMERRRRSSGDL